MVFVCTAIHPLSSIYVPITWTKLTQVLPHQTQYFQLQLKSCSWISIFRMELIGIEILVLLNIAFLPSILEILGAKFVTKSDMIPDQKLCTSRHMKLRTKGTCTQYLTNREIPSWHPIKLMIQMDQDSVYILTKMHIIELWNIIHYIIQCLDATTCEIYAESAPAPTTNFIKQYWFWSLHKSFASVQCLHDKSFRYYYQVHSVSTNFK